MVDKKQKAFGTLVKRLRKERNLTQGELAELVDLTQSNISRIEIGEYDAQHITVLTIARLAEVFNIPVEILVSAAVYGKPPEQPLKSQNALTDSIFLPSRMSQTVQYVREITEENRTFGHTIPNWDSSDNPAFGNYILNYYFPKFELLDDNHKRLTFLIYALAPVYTNLYVPDYSDYILNQTEAIATKSGFMNDAAIKSGLLMGRAWNAAYRGHFESSRILFDDALISMQQLETESQAETVYHFRGRLALESQSALLFYELPLLATGH